MLLNTEELGNDNPVADNKPNQAVLLLMQAALRLHAVSLRQRHSNLETAKETVATSGAGGTRSTAASANGDISDRMIEVVDLLEKATFYGDGQLQTAFLEEIYHQFSATTPELVRMLFDEVEHPLPAALARPSDDELYDRSSPANGNVSRQRAVQSEPLPEVDPELPTSAVTGARRGVNRVASRQITVKEFTRPKKKHKNRSHSSSKSSKGRARGRSGSRSGPTHVDETPLKELVPESDQRRRSPRLHQARGSAASTNKTGMTGVTPRSMRSRKRQSDDEAVPCTPARGPKRVLPL